MAIFGPRFFFSKSMIYDIFMRWDLLVNESARVLYDKINGSMILEMISMKLRADFLVVVTEKKPYISIFSPLLLMKKLM